MATHCGVPFARVRGRNPQKSGKQHAAKGPSNRSLWIRLLFFMSLFGVSRPEHTPFPYDPSGSVSPRHLTRAWLALGNAPHRLDQTGIGTAATSLVSLGAPGLSKARTGPALARFQTVLHMLDRFTFAGRAYHFPSAISLSIALSKVRSATAARSPTPTRAAF